MSLRPEELSAIATELTRELEGGFVQKVHAPTTTRVYFEVRVPGAKPLGATPMGGKSVTLLLCSDHHFARVSVVEERPANPATPPTWQSVLRTDLIGAKFADAEVLTSRRTLLLHFTKGDKFLNLILECTNEPSIIFCTGEAQIRSLSIPNRPGLRVGQRWEPLEEMPSFAGGATGLKPIKPLPSRLQGDQTFLRLARAAEALLASTEQKTAVDARRAPILSRLKKLERTKEKVRAEADRTSKAHQLRLEGELINQNLHLLKRGLPRVGKTVRLTGYGQDGEHLELELTLDPAKTPQQNAEQRFHQYRRLVRGQEIARKRLLELDEESRSLQVELAAVDSAPLPALPEPKAKKSQQEALPPYREYLGHGQRIWVGRGSAHNDTLTFRTARPFHVWFHARGVPGAHVVVPLEKNGELKSEVLLDAAHLAAHHSDAKGEPRVEVSYTEVKFVHKPKDAPAGAVTFTREKTLLLRLEPDRLKALLSTEKSA